MNSILPLWAVLMFAATACAEDAVLNADASKEPVVQDAVSCNLTGDPTCEIGKPPQILVALTNHTDADFYLVGSLDASDCVRRFPHCYFEVIGPDGKSAVRPVNRCKLMNPLRVKDFVKVPSGESFDPYQKLDDHGFFSAHQLSQRNFQEPGLYRIRFVYSTCSDDIAKWRGDAANKQIVDLLRQVPRCEVRSEEFELTVIPPAPQQQKAEPGVGADSR